MDIIDMMENIFELVLYNRENSIKFFPSNGYCEIFIKAKYDLSIKIYHEIIDNLYNISILYNDAYENAIILSSYKTYKSYVRKNLSHKRKHDFWDHMKVLSLYISEFEFLFKDRNELMNYLSKSKLDFQYIFI